MPFPALAPDPATVLGLMSGTSADGVDAALCRLGTDAASTAREDGPRGSGETRVGGGRVSRTAGRHGSRRAGAVASAAHGRARRSGAGRQRDSSRDPAAGLRVEVLAARTYPYPADLRERVLGAAALTTPELAALNVDLGERFAAAAVGLCREAGVALEAVDLIGSHGQTVWHDPRGARGFAPATLQLGEPAVIAARSGRSVVADFRPADVALGGEGAPLVPLVDFLLLSRPGLPRAVLNLGGIANVTWLPGTARAADVKAFDTGPGNMLLDGLVRRLGLAPEGYDPEGRLALDGRVHEELLGDLLSEPFFALPPPRSAGRELFGEVFVERAARRGGELGLPPADLLATAAALTARSAADAVLRFCGRPAEVLLCGGGRRNHAVREALEALLPEASVRDTDQEGLDGDAKEAVAFAVLGWLAARGAPNHLPHTTGASRRAILGKFVWGGAP